MASTVSRGPFQPFVGTYAGTGSAIAVADIGFKPHVVIVVNETDGDAMFIKIQGMADDDTFLIRDSGSGTTDLTQDAAGGITLDDEGFDVGTDSVMNESAKTYRYFGF